jgi:hypothetical protein
VAGGRRVIAWAGSVAWFTARGVTVERVLSDNGSAYKSYAWREGLHRSGHPAQEDPPLPPTDQRQRWNGFTAP